MMTVTVIGAGYVGLTTGLTLAYLGHDVCCLDVDEHKIAALRSGRIPIYEPFAADLLALAQGRLRFTSDSRDAIRSAHVIIMAVNTPASEDGRANLQHVRSAADAVGRHIAADHVVVVNKSTVPIGSANLVENLIRHTFAQHHGDTLNGRIGIVSNPEFLREGSAIHDSLYPDRIVIGANDDRSLAVMQHLYAPIVEQSFAPPPFLPRPPGARVEVLRTSVVSAEMIKYASNAFLATKISFANELSVLAERSGADIQDVVRGIGMDRRIGSAFLAAGLGWGGSCFGKDTAALATIARDYGVSMPITEAARTVNVRQRELAVTKLQNELKILQGRTVGLLGLSFKPDTDDVRDSPAIDVAKRLLTMGVRLRAHDPCAIDQARQQFPSDAVEFCDSAVHVASDADAIFLATEWSQYAALPWREIAVQMRTPLVIDARNFLDRAELQRAGFRYVGVGR